MTTLPPLVWVLGILRHLATCSWHQLRLELFSHLEEGGIFHHPRTWRIRTWTHFTSPVTSMCVYDSANRAEMSYNLDWFWNSFQTMFVCYGLSVTLISNTPIWIAPKMKCKDIYDWKKLFRLQMFGLQGCLDPTLHLFHIVCNNKVGSNETHK